MPFLFPVSIFLLKRNLLNIFPYFVDLYIVDHSEEEDKI